MSFNLFDDDDDDGVDSLFLREAPSKQESEENEEQKLPELPFSSKKEPEKIRKRSVEVVGEVIWQI